MPPRKRRRTSTHFKPVEKKIHELVEGDIITSEKFSGIYIVIESSNQFQDYGHGDTGYCWEIKVKELNDDWSYDHSKETVTYSPTYGPPHDLKSATVIGHLTRTYV